MNSIIHVEIQQGMNPSSDPYIFALFLLPTYSLGKERGELCQLPEKHSM